MITDKYLFLLLILLAAHCLLSETALIDSLEQELKWAKGEDRYEILHDLGWQYRKISFEKALGYESSAVNMARDWGDSLRVARSLYHLARIYSKQDYDKAVALAERSIEMIEVFDEKNLAKYIRNLGYIYGENFKYDDAKSCYLLAYEKSLAFSDVYEAAYNLDNLYNIYIKMNLYNKALETAQKKLKIWHKFENEYKIAKSYNDFGRAHYFLGNFKIALTYYFDSLMKLELLEKKSKEEYLSEKAATHFNISLIYNSLSNYQLFIKHCRLCLQYSELIQKTEYIPICYSQLSLMYYYINNYEISYYLNMRALIETPKNETYNLLGSILFYLSYVSFHENRQKEALKYIKLVKKLYSYTNDEWKLSFFFQRMGMYYEILDEKEEAIRYYSLAIKNCKNINAYNTLAENYINISRVYLSSNNYEESIENANLAIIHAKKQSNLKLIRDVYLIFSQFYEIKNQINESINYLKLYETYQDSIISLDNLNAISQMDIEIKNLEKQKELELLQQENELITAELGKEKYTRIKLVIIASALIILTLILILYNHLIKRTNSKLEKEISMRKSSEAELQQLSSSLQEQVLERTAELQKANYELQLKKDERINSEKKLLEIEKMAGVGQMAAGIAHEIRNPIAIIRSTAQYLADTYSNARNSMKIVTRNSDIINDIISRLMNFARLKPLELQKINLQELLLDLPAKFEQQLQKKNIEFQLTIPDDLPDIAADPELFLIMISDLIENSIEAMSPKGKLELSINEKKDIMEIVLKDNGKGMKDTKQARRSFYTTKPGRAGLGFNYINYIAGIHNYLFNLISKINKGTEARIILVR